MRISKVLFVGIFLIGVTAVPVRSEAGDNKSYSPAGRCAHVIMDQDAGCRDLFLPYPNSFGRRYLRDYYFVYPYQEKSPYEGLVIRPAGELEISVRPAQAQVFVDGYKVEKEKDSYSIGLLTGAHSVEVIAEGYEPYREEVQIEEGKKRVLSITLTH